MVQAKGDSCHWVLTCEHATKRVPRKYAALGLPRAALADHIGWDIGAGAVQRVLARELPAEAVSSRVSRLLVDANRMPHEESLIPLQNDGIVVPGNASVSAAERKRRIRLYHEPYHARVNKILKRATRTAPGRVRLLSLHSFTPQMGGRVRDFDIGVLFDAHVGLAHAFGRALVREEFRVRYNEPYSGYDGLIYAPKRHGEAHDVPYVELEINNRLIRDPAAAGRVGRRIARALRAL